MKDSFSKFDTIPLRELLKKSDSGTWGDEAECGEGAPVLRSTNIVDNRLCLHDPAWRHLSDAHRKHKRLHDGDIIVTSSSGSADHIGKCAVFETPESNGKAYYFSNFTLRLRPITEKLESKWLYYWLTSPRGRHEMLRLNSTTTGLRNLNKDAYLSQLIPLPKLEEQKRIAAILDKADAIRRKRQEAIDTLQDLREASFLDCFGDPEKNQKNWTTRRIGDVAKLQGGYAFKSSDYVADGVRLVKISNVHQEFLEWDEVDSLPRSYIDRYHEYSLKVGDIVLALTRPIIKSLDSVKVARVTEQDVPCLLNQRVSRFVIKIDTEILGSYLLHFLYSASFKKSVEKICSVSLQPNMSTRQVEDILIPLPPFRLQQEFERALIKIESCQHWNLNALNEAGRLFNSLVQRAFKGEL
jgi:type I restriction enzyme S subunit